MASHQLRALMHRMNVTPRAKATAPAPVAGDELAEVLQRYVNEAVAKALNHAPSRPASARLHDLQASLAQSMPGPVNPPSRPLREAYENIPAAAKVSPLPASQLIEPTTAPAGGKMPGTRVAITGRDMNNHIATLIIAAEGQPDTTVVVNARDANGHILGVAVNGRQGQRQFHIQRDMNGLIAGLIEG